MKIKICGIKSVDTAAVLNECKADYMGFVFAKNSSRTVSIETAQEISQRLSSDIKKVGVFVDEDIEEIKNIVSLGIIDIVQLHGQESAEYIRQLKSDTRCPVIKAVWVGKTHEISLAYKEADAVLVDYYSKDTKGGSGKAFDWSSVDFSQFGKSVFLAGGINLSNIKEAKNIPFVDCVDISSGAETDGAKDNDKIRQLVQAIK